MADLARKIAVMTGTRADYGLLRPLIAELETLLQSADESSTGPAHIVLEDPDGNQIMLDQHR